MPIKTAEEWLGKISHAVFEDRYSLDGEKHDNTARIAVIKAIQQNAIASRDSEVWKCCEELANALNTDQMTVECASLDVQRGGELPWYKQMKSALATFTALKLKMEGKE